MVATVGDHCAWFELLGSDLGFYLSSFFQPSTLKPNLTQASNTNLHCHYDPIPWLPGLCLAPSLFPGRVHYVRFCARSDIEADVRNNLIEFEDFPLGRHPRSAGDIVLIAKRWMADTEILRVIALVPEATAKQIRIGMSCPQGIAGRRAIGHRVYDNIQKHASRGKKTGDLRGAAADYLLQWSSDSLAQFPRPRTYSILTYRWDHAMHREALSPGAWTTPSRLRHVDLAIDAEDHGLTSESEDEDTPLDLPSALQN